MKRPSGADIILEARQCHADDPRLSQRSRSRDRVKGAHASIGSPPGGNAFVRHELG
jgi:hypothetical protein